jgi:2-polyprenyl-6-methoxyphenol hydroxylase-like FAD-dependent oxidoreductase
MMTTTDVLIAGAGPVGLLLAAELSRDGVGVLLIDRMLERTFFCKALGVTPRTLEIFDSLGIAHDAIDAGIWMHGVSSFNDGVPGVKMEVPTDLPFGSLSLAQFETERLLENCLHQHGGKVCYGSVLTGFDATADEVRVTVEGPGSGQRTVDCRWLVGCDGAHSRVRSIMGLNFEGDRYPQTFVLADLEVDWDLPRGWLYRFNRAGTAEYGSTSLVAIPVHGSGRRYRLSTIVPESTPHPKDVAGGDGMPPNIEEVTSLMSPLLPSGTVLSSLHWSSVYRVSHRIVPTYSQGRVFLAGDAAHLHPPVGGQGMNTGLQDAHNLAWKLALASRKLDAPGLLDSYSAERHPVGQDVVQNTSRALNDVLAQRVQLPGMRETQLLISYRNSPIVKDERPDAAARLFAAGDRVPDVGQLRRSFVDKPFRLYERLKAGRHILIGFISDDKVGAETLAKMLSLLRAVMSDAASGFAVMPTGCMAAEREYFPVVIDAGGEFAAAFSAEPGMAWLVRPDGYIGWCSASPSIESLQTFLKLIVQNSGTGK